MLMRGRASKRERMRGRRFTNDPVFDVTSQVLRRSTPYTIQKKQQEEAGGTRSNANGQVHAYTQTGCFLPFLLFLQSLL